MINYDLINILSSNLKRILDDELKVGNSIHETFLGRFSEDKEDHLYIWLKYPFKTPIRNDLEGVVFSNIDDPHYWKAEYNDIFNFQTLACNFGL
ncbi:MAG: hypothetical protein PUI48_06190 [Oscillospiraceae bacterium]|nr:hypothetical protein [Oscillospiraceae bacterium]MDY6209194.1 hypothetical protein [Oscillospiraceae bacterium]